MIRLFVLDADNETPIQCDDPFVWAKEMRFKDREHAAAVLRDRTVRVLFRGFDREKDEEEDTYVWEVVVTSTVDDSFALMRFPSKREALAHFGGIVSDAT